jgi:tRNA 2-thiouridine synthesizing protein A
MANVAMSSSSAAAPQHVDREWDAGDLGCGELVIHLRFRLKAMQPGEVIRVHATDAGAPQDLPAWCRMTGEALIHHDTAQHLYFIRRG